MRARAWLDALGCAQLTNEGQIRGGSRAAWLDLPLECIGGPRDGETLAPRLAEVVSDPWPHARVLGGYVLGRWRGELCWVWWPARVAGEVAR